jgi:PadR family transcriptional regulator AphA
VRLNDLSLTDQVVLALIAEEPRHGFGIAAEIAHDEALSMAIVVRRPLVYRSLNHLEDARLIEPSRTEAGKRGAPRTIYRATKSGIRQTDEWLEAVVTHPRDARIELLAKFALRSRRGLSNRRLAARQRKHFEPIAASLKKSVATSSTADLVRKWRHESINAMVGLLRELERS